MDEAKNESQKSVESFVIQPILTNLNGTQSEEKIPQRKEEDESESIVEIKSQEVALEEENQNDR